MRKIKIFLYGFYIYNHVLIAMIKDGDYFRGWQDFKDFVNTGKDQINQYGESL